MAWGAYGVPFLSCFTPATQAGRTNHTLHWGLEVCYFSILVAKSTHRSVTKVHFNDAENTASRRTFFKRQRRHTVKTVHRKLVLLY
jgi:hypothetical protein